MSQTRQIAEEEEANYFAMILLMPEEFVIRELERFEAIHGHPFDLTRDKDVQIMATIFEVPLGICAIRLAQIKLPY